MMIIYYHKVATKNSFDNNHHFQYVNYKEKFKRAIKSWKTFIPVSPNQIDWRP